MRLIGLLTIVNVSVVIEKVKKNESRIDYTH